MRYTSILLFAVISNFTFGQTSILTFSQEKETTWVVEAYCFESLTREPLTEGEDYTFLNHFGPSGGVRMVADLKGCYCVTEMLNDTTLDYHDRTVQQFYFCQGQSEFVER